MEADEYFSTFDALQNQQKKEQAVRKQLPLKTNENCGISKIVWSQFDFMTGPELKFVWEVTPSTSISPVNLSGEDGSIADGESLVDSGGSNQSVSFEEIDDPLKTELTILEGLDDSCLESLSELNLLQCGDYKYKTMKYLDEYMMTDSTTTTSTKTLTMEDSRIESPGSSAKSIILSPEDKMFIASPSPNDTGHLGKLLATKYPNDEERELADILREKMANETDETMTEGVAHLSEHYELDRYSPIFQQQDDELRRSCVDSGVGVSTHSDLSAFCHTPPKKRDEYDEDDVFNGPMTSTPNIRSRSRTTTPPPKDIFNFFDDQIDFGDYVSDEAFVAKCVLAELICNMPHSRCPLQHKLIVSPSRHLLVAAFIFSAQTKHGNTITYAISFLMPNEKQDWYMDRQMWFERMVGDSVPKMKASLFAEDSDDVLVRVTSELTRLLALLSALERFSLVAIEKPLMIKNTLFTERAKIENRLLCRSISGCLQSQGHTVIIGSDHQIVARMMYTLAFFVPLNLQWCCLRPYRHKYNPYLRIQAVRRAELPSIILSGTSSPWPICIIDLDRSAVCFSANYQRHRILRARNDSRGVRVILEHAGVMSSARNEKAPQLELSNCRSMECVNTFVKRMDLLPMEESVRATFCSQLMLYIDNLAIAFIAFVRDSSRPGKDEKECGTRSRHFNLAECRKSLDLTQDAIFNAVLARAELLQPDISEFIYM
ncbi:unnamed protein product [Caenorhabditis angaria]|uniref:Uncharacterized protein n=1 Tax=Caenorhabditis angaria TaxID=860376 RepID=A0A9P1I8S7_9PELO|nr:unnamed protein product [Caenorhabditis angaria]